MHGDTVAVRTTPSTDVGMVAGVYGRHRSIRGTKLRFWVAPSLAVTHFLVRSRLPVVVVQGMGPAARREGGVFLRSGTLSVLGQVLFPAISLAVGIEPVGYGVM